MEQMGYQAESGSWRGHYLTGAQELRHGTPDLPSPGTATPDTVRAMNLTLLFNYLAFQRTGPAPDELHQVEDVVVRKPFE